MIHHRPAALALLLLAPFVHAQNKDKKAQPPAEFFVRCERDDALYKTGEKAKFVFKSPVAGEAYYAFTEDGHKVIRNGSVMMDANKFYSLEQGLDHPGFLQLKITQGKTTKLAAAGFDPTKIVPSAPPPADFDAFWQKQLDAVKDVPLDAQLDPWPAQSILGVDAYKLTFKVRENRFAYGALAVPKWEGPFPAILTVPYAGVYPVEPEAEQARLGAITLNLIIHEFPVDITKAEAAKFAADKLKDYRKIGFDDREKSYFLDGILACYRAVEFLRSRKDFNGKDLAVTGSSQGGGLSIITAGLHPKVTVLASNVPALCDHTGFVKERVSGWPKWVAAATGEQKNKAEEAARYYDAVNFARKVKAKSLVGVGFIDTVCPPTSVYAAFNELPEPKSILTSPLMGHSTDPRYSRARIEFFKKHMQMRPVQ
jgi:cephalosporin-C deacetylase-like acetyl esterase